MPFFLRKEKPVFAYRWGPNTQIQRHVQTNVEGYGVPIVETVNGIKEITPGDWVVETYDGKVMVLSNTVFTANFELTEAPA